MSGVEMAVIYAKANAILNRGQHPTLGDVVELAQAVTDLVEEIRALKKSGEKS